MEAAMARISDALNSLIAQQQEASAAQLVSFSNLQGAVDRLRESAANGDLSEADQKAVDQLSAGFEAMVRDAQIADDGVDESAAGDTPAEGGPVTEGAGDGASTADATAGPDVAATEGDASTGRR